MVEVAFASSAGSSAAAPRRLRGELVVRDAIPYAGVAPPPPALPLPQPQLQPQVQATTSGGGGGGKISPAVLFIIVILAVVFFICGLLHLLVRLLMKKQHRAEEEGIRWPGCHGRPPGMTEEEGTWHCRGCCSSCSTSLLARPPRAAPPHSAAERRLLARPSRTALGMGKGRDEEEEGGES